MTATWIREDGSGNLVLHLHVQPGAGKTAVAGLHGEALKIRLAAPPVDGRANDALVAFLARRLGIAKAGVELVAGASSREKRVRISGVSRAEAVSLLADVD
jgi:uncharacterized protein (TIGR00251 family)